MLLIGLLNKIVWSVAISLIIVYGIYFTYKLDFIQFRIFKQIKALIPNKNIRINSFNTLSMSLASKIGVGSISGIALAIYYGGAGVIFWMWIGGIICSINTYMESFFGNKYHVKNGSKSYIGGPSYYMKGALGNNRLAFIYSFILIIAYLFGFLPIQSNTIVASINMVLDIKYLSIIIVCLLSYLVIHNNNDIILKVCSIIVPIMALIYLLIGIYVIIINIYKIPDIFILIFKEAFNIKTGIVSTVILGIQRGLFASEAGIGTSAIASASSSESADKQGLSQVFGIHFTIFVVCNITAFIILCSSYNVGLNNINGVEITLNAFNQLFGIKGSILLCIIVIMFAFSTIISCYYYTESSLIFIFNKLSNNKLQIYKFFFIIMLFIGGIVNSNIIWSIVDLLVAILTIINVSVIKKIFYKKKHWFN